MLSSLSIATNSSYILTHSPSFLSLFSAAIDAKRVAGGEEMAEDAVVDPQLELTITKCAEIFAESIPSSFLQTYALLKAREVDSAAFFSVISSVSAIAFAGATISLDYDIDPVKRINSPSFYVSFTHNYPVLSQYIKQFTSIHIKQFTNILLLLLFFSFSNRAIYRTRIECWFSH